MGSFFFLILCVIGALAQIQVPMDPEIGMNTVGPSKYLGSPKKALKLWCKGK